MRHESLAHYLAAVGAASILNVGTRWRDGVCEYGMSIHDAVEKIEKALLDRETLPPLETEHPLWCNRGRRSLVRGVAAAAEWLRELGPSKQGARYQELSALLEGKDYPQPPLLPPANAKDSKGKAMNPSWNLGTLMPGVVEMDDNPTRPVSAWVAILAWEAQRVIVSTELKARGVGALEEDAYSWCAPEWSEPLTLAEQFLLLSGGLSRWEWTGLPSSMLTLRYYHLRDTTGAGKTKEFCRGNEVLYFHPDLA